MVVDLASGDRRRPLVEQAGHGADQPRLTLAPLAQHDDVVSGDERSLDVRQDRLVEPDDAGEAVLSSPHSGEQILSYFLLDASVDMAAGAQFTERGRFRCPVVPSACTGLLAILVHRFDTMSATGVFASSAGQSSFRRCTMVCAWQLFPRWCRPTTWSPPARLLRDVISPTPLQYSRVLSEQADGPVYLKCENLQRTGSFKVRGAYVRIARMSAEERARGVVAASAGNHAQGVAFAAGLLGTHATVVMPERAPLPKVEATRAYGADVDPVRLVGGGRARGGVAVRGPDRQRVHPPVRPSRTSWRGKAPSASRSSSSARRSGRSWSRSAAAAWRPGSRWR